MVKSNINNCRESKQSPWFPGAKHQWLFNQSQGHYLHCHGTSQYGTCFCLVGPHLQKDTSQLERVQRRAAKFCCSDYTNRTRGCVDNVLKVLHWESLETRRKSNRPSLLHKINARHVDITIYQYLQRSDPRMRGAQRFRHARADHPALYPLFFLQHFDSGIGSHKSINHHIHRSFQGWPSFLNICFNFFISLYVHNNNNKNHQRSIE